MGERTGYGDEDAAEIRVLKVGMKIDTEKDVFKDWRGMMRVWDG